MNSFSRRAVATLLGAALVAVLPGGGAAAAEPLVLRAPDGREVRLFDDFTWEYVESEGTTEGALLLRLERKVDAPQGCRFALRLSNGAPYRVVSLVPQISAFDARDVRIDTVYVSFAGIKPTLEQYQEIQFRGLACADIARLELHGGARCNMGDLDRFTAGRGQCLAQGSLGPDPVFPIAK